MSTRENISNWMEIAGVVFKGGQAILDALDRGEIDDAEAERRWDNVNKGSDMADDAWQDAIRRRQERLAAEGGGD